MDPLGLGDTHLSKKKANNPMFAHTQSQNTPNTPPRKPYYNIGSNDGTNKYGMVMGKSNLSKNLFTCLFFFFLLKKNIYLYIIK